MTNLSTLQRNMLATMSEEAGELYLRGCDRDEWKACQMAWEADVLVRAVPSMIDTAYRILVEQKPHLRRDAAISELWDYLKERQFRRWFPDGREKNP